MRMKQNQQMTLKRQEEQLPNYNQRANQTTTKHKYTRNIQQTRSKAQVKTEQVNNKKTKSIYTTSTELVKRKGQTKKQSK